MFLFRRATNDVSLGHSTPKEHLQAYASVIQGCTRNRHDRVSLDWRFLHPIQNEAVHVVQSLQSLTGWHTIAFQIRMSHDVRELILQFSKDAFLKRSDNYYVRIDEISIFTVGDISMNRSTLIINGHALDPVERRVHEHVCPYSSWRWIDDDWDSNNTISILGRWETSAIRI